MMNKYYLQIIKTVFFLWLNFNTTSWAMGHKDKLWSSFTLMGNYGKFVYNVEPQFRFIDSGNTLQQFLYNMGGGYQVSSDWQIWLGQTFSTDSQDVALGSVDEYRIWQQIMWNHSFLNMQFISRTRVEERQSFYFPDWACRFRERLLINKPLSNNMSLVLSDEIFINLNSTPWVITKTFDQNRAYIGVEQQLSVSTYFGVGYMSQYLSFKKPQLDNVLVLNVRMNLAT